MKKLLDKIINFKIPQDFEFDNKKKILAVILCIIVLYLDFGVIMKAQLGGLKKIAPKIKKVKLDLSTLNKDLLRMQNIKNADPAAARKEAQKVMRLIPEGQISFLLQGISENANKNFVAITRIKPAKELPAKGVVVPQNLTAYLISVDLSGDYHNLGKFINVLENGEVFLTVQNLRIQPDRQDLLKQKINLVLKTYVTK
ncbi:MAG: type 4a pilus biogenesis protein PilO [Candidatus Omnitrophica bacterium]|nr:type 4a pilus biogenesis protein PilO [Candidatus Omnitrophota bacterium]